jgi:hypothetical protein
MICSLKAELPFNMVTGAVYLLTGYKNISTGKMRAATVGKKGVVKAGFLCLFAPSAWPSNLM